MSRFFDVMRDRSRWLRMRREGDEGKVVYPELFFDLVFVFSIVQLSHTLAEHYSPAGIGKDGSAAQRMPSFSRTRRMDISRR